jgi:excisionase family DNA binding protein
MEPLTVNIREAERVTGLGRTTLKAMVRSGELPSVKVGRKRLIYWQSLKAVLQIPE